MAHDEDVAFSTPPEEVLDEQDDTVNDDLGWKRPRDLPADLPTSLDDRRRDNAFDGETEMYDGWQGKTSLDIPGIKVLTFYRSVAVHRSGGQDEQLQPQSPRTRLRCANIPGTR